MDSRFQSSFIPKASVTGTTLPTERKSVFRTLSLIVFVLVLLGTGGTFVYKIMMEKSITALEAKIAEAEKAVDKDKIDELANFDKRVKSIDTILNQHVAVSSYLKLLGDSTLKNLSFSDFKFTATDHNSPIKAVFTGVAPSYAAIAQEEAVLVKDPNTVSVQFGDFLLGKTGLVSFKLTAEFKNGILNWSKTLLPVEVDAAAVASTTTTQ